MTCSRPDCSLPALMIHSTGCKEPSCAQHAYPGTVCPACSKPLAMEWEWWAA